MFYDVANPYGTELFTPPALVEVKPHKLPKTKKGVRVIRAPKPPSTILRNFLLNYNG